MFYFVFPHSLCSGAECLKDWLKSRIKTVVLSCLCCCLKQSFIIIPIDVESFLKLIIVWTSCISSSFTRIIFFEILKTEINEWWYFRSVQNCHFLLKSETQFYFVSFQGHLLWWVIPGALLFTSNDLFWSQIISTSFKVKALSRDSLFDLNYNSRFSWQFSILITDLVISF